MKPLDEIANNISDMLKSEGVRLEFYFVNGGKQSVMGLTRQVGNRIERFKPKTLCDNPLTYSLTEFEIVEEII